MKKLSLIFKSLAVFSGFAVMTYFTRWFEQYDIRNFYRTHANRQREIH